MECKVSWMGQDGMAFAAETGSGHLVTMDGAPEGGGRNLAPRPMEMVLLGTGGWGWYRVGDADRGYGEKQPGGLLRPARERQGHQLQWPRLLVRAGHHRAEGQSARDQVV